MKNPTSGRFKTGKNQPDPKRHRLDVIKVNTIKSRLLKTGGEQVSIIERGRSLITIYSEKEAFDSHRIRFLLATKNINCKIIDVDRNNLPEDLLAQGNDVEIPTLVDRDMHLYGINVITEYLDERYPHPPLMPPDPMTRARLRFTVYRLERGWFSYVDKIENAAGKARTALISELSELLAAAEPLFSEHPYFLNPDMTLVDTHLVPFLWRLEHYGVDWEALPKSLRNYAHRMFQSPAFKKSITETEREYRFDF